MKDASRTLKRFIYVWNCTSSHAWAKYRHREMLIWKISFRFFECKCEEICCKFPIRSEQPFLTLYSFFFLQHRKFNFLFVAFYMPSFSLFFFVVPCYHFLFIFSKEAISDGLDDWRNSVYQFFVMKTYVAAKLVLSRCLFSFISCICAQIHLVVDDDDDYDDDCEGEVRKNSLERWLMNFINCESIFHTFFAY